MLTILKLVLKIVAWYCFFLNSGHARSPSQDLQTASTEANERSQVVAVGTALPTSALPVGAHQGPVMVSLNRNYAKITRYFGTRV